MRRIRLRSNGIVSAYLGAASLLALTFCALGQQDAPPAASIPSVDQAAVQPASQPETGTAGAEEVIKRTGSNRFTMTFKEGGMDMRLALHMLSMLERRNIVVAPEVTGTVWGTLHDVTFDEALEAVLAFGGHRYISKGRFIYVYTRNQYEEILKALRKLKVRTFRLSYVTAKDVKVLIAPVLSADSKVAETPVSGTGVATSDSDAGGNSYPGADLLVISDYEDNLKKVAEIIKTVDIRPKQVLVEATILISTLDDDDKLGVNFNALSGISFRGLSSQTAGLADVTPGTLTSTAFANNNMGTIRTDFAAVTGGLRLGFISNQVAFFVSALEKVNDTTVVANPKLLILDRQRGEVLIGNRQGYLTTTVSEGISTQTVEFLETGTRLVVRPFICPDGHIRLELHPEESTGALDANGLPTENTTEVTSNVLVRDGHTIVIGGLFREETQNVRSQVPLMGNLPYLGGLFRSTQDAVLRTETILLITPHIIRHDVDERISEQMRDEIERFRIGQRRGMRWWSRTQLAGSQIRQARKAMRAGDREKALWHIDTALSIDPRMEEGMRLKERLTEQVYWADQPRYSSIKYVIQRMIMADLGMPYERIIPPAKPRVNTKVDPKILRKLGMGMMLEDPLPKNLFHRLKSVLKGTGKSTDQNNAPAAKAKPTEAKPGTDGPAKGKSRKGKKKGGQ